MLLMLARIHRIQRTQIVAGAQRARQFLRSHELYSAENMEWPREKCLKLIDQYEKHPVLWNPNDGMYYNRVKKCDSWTAIDEIMGCGPGEAKKKMESILASFRREKIKGKAGRGKGKREIYVSKWFAFERLAFLLDKNEPRRTIYSSPWGEEDVLDDPPENDGEKHNHNNEEEASDDEQNGEIVTQSSSQKFSLETSTSNSSASPKKTNKRKKPPETEDDSRLEEAFLILKRAISNKGDECGVYGQHVANKLRSYSKRTRNIVQHHMNTILFNADMGQYDTGQTDGGPGSNSYSCSPHHASAPTPLSQSQTMTLNMSDSEEEATNFEYESS